jgi:hypothetical protein
MQKKINASILCTLVVTALHAMYLAVLSNSGKLPVETNLVFWRREWTIPLPFEVSLWWGLVWPLLVEFLVVYWLLKDEIIGTEPRNSNGSGARKHDARTLVMIMTSIAGAVAVGTFAIESVMAPFAMDNTGGPLSGLVTCGAWFAGGYVGFGFGVAALSTLTKSSYDWEDTPTDVFIPTFTTYVKMGILKTFPFILGTTTGFMLRRTFDLITRPFRGEQAPMPTKK